MDRKRYRITDTEAMDRMPHIVPDSVTPRARHPADILRRRQAARRRPLLDSNTASAEAGRVPEAWLHPPHRC